MLSACVRVWLDLFLYLEGLCVSSWTWELGGLSVSRGAGRSLGWRPPPGGVRPPEKG